MLGFWKVGVKIAQKRQSHQELDKNEVRETKN